MGKDFFDIPIPYDEGAERAVLGSLIVHYPESDFILNILKPEDFYEERNRIVYETIIEIINEGHKINAQTIKLYLEKKGKLEEIGGLAYILELIEESLPVDALEPIVKDIKDKAVARGLIELAKKIIVKAKKIKDVNQLIEEAEAEIFRLNEERSVSEYYPISEIIQQVLKIINDLSKKDTIITGIPSGFYDLDKLTTGFHEGDLVIIAARPAMGKCLAKGTKVLMYDGKLKKVEEIKVGDLLMGANSEPRKVLALGHGKEQMYLIKQKHGIDYKVNENHILTLKKTTGKDKGKIINIPVKEYLNKPKSFKKAYKGFKTEIEFLEKKVEIEPYFLGLWLISGKIKEDIKIETKHIEVLFYLKNIAKKHSFYIDVKIKEKNYKTRIKNSFKKQATIWEILEKHGLIKDRFIPLEYIANSKQNRLELLAGLIDGGGYYIKSKNIYQFKLNNERLIKDIKLLADTLGFRTKLEQKKYKKKKGIKYTLKISGDIDKIPVKVKKHKAKPWKAKYNWRTTEIEIQPIEEKEYFGFELDGDGLFLLEDMTITHNTSFALSILHNVSVIERLPSAFFSLEMSKEQIGMRLLSLESRIPLKSLRSGFLGEKELEKITEVALDIAKSPIYIDDTASLSILELRAKARRLKRERDIKIIVIDYLQLMRSHRRTENRQQEVAEISRGLKALAKELNIPVIALAQLSRQVEIRADKRPQLADLRESGCLTGDTLVINADTGELVPIKEMVGKTFNTLSLDKDLKIRKFKVLKVFYSGRKKVYRLKTKSGREIKASANHPFLKLEGWTRLDQLKIGDKIAVPRNKYLSKKMKKTNRLLTLTYKNFILLALDNEGKEFISYLILQKLANGNIKVYLSLIEKNFDNDIFWDEIVEIEELGIEDVYDMTIEKVHNFIANDIIVHNSIEQDADLVMFIHRPEYYKKNPTPEEEGLAEIIIAKQRNGPTGVVKLAFIKDITKFENLAMIEEEGIDIIEEQAQQIEEGSILNENEDLFSSFEEDNLLDNTSQSTDDEDIVDL